MANELTALPEFTRCLFKHAYLFLPWFCRTCNDYRFKVNDVSNAVDFVEALKKDKTLFFGSSPELAKANRKLLRFYDAAKPKSKNPDSNSDAIHYLRRAWFHAWKNRHVFGLRGHEVRLMKFFHEIYVLGKAQHLADLQCMARLIDQDVVRLARSIYLPGGWTPSRAVIKANAELRKLETALFNGKEPTPELCNQVRRRKAKTYARFQKLMRDRKEAARQRITEIFDEQEWFPIVKSATLYEHLREEGLDDLLPSTFRGRVGVQPTGYPLTFYTYAGLELDSPPINEVTMNPNYGTEEPDKDYKIHPVTDGTFYCETKAVVGDSKTKHYTLEYKRRARRLKYDSVEKLEQVIDQVRAKLIEHLQSDHRDTWVRALMCLLIDKYCARIGNEASAKREDKKTYGITTLRNSKHVQLKKEYIIIEYSGKHCQPQRHALPIYRTSQEQKDHPLETLISNRLIELILEKRRYLFTRTDRKQYTPQMVNDYFTASIEPNAEANLPYGGAGSPCTVHNMRNFHATRLFRQYSEKFLHRKPNPTYEEVLIAYQGRNKTKSHRGHPGVLSIVARMLGNTPSICRKSYIDPREQLLFFQRWNFRPPDCIIRDLFVQEDEDTYGLRRVIRGEQKRARELAKQSI
ncbi:MAG: hypothetical protein JXA82_07860 [Sedimentisphaerales bacterium]|nr:hypothetical protein [Sedimentisphaerales bacterium]